MEFSICYVVNMKTLFYTYRKSMLYRIDKAWDINKNFNLQEIPINLIILG